MSTIQDNAAARRFEMAVDGHTVFATYRRDGSRLIIDHVEAPVALRGTGAAGKFMEALAEGARDRGETIVPLCGYAAAWLGRSEKYRGLVR